MQQSPIKVVLCGSPHSGKSYLRDGLKQAMMSMHRDGKAPYKLLQLSSKVYQYMMKPE